MPYLQTSADFIGRVYNFLREPSATPQYWSSSHVADLLDEAHAKVIADFWLSRAEWIANTKAAGGLGDLTDGTYLLPNSLLVLRHVLYQDSTTGGIYTKLSKKGVNDLLVSNYAASGTPTNWAIIGMASAGATTWTQVGSGLTETGLSGQGFLLRIWPAPQASAASGLYIVGSTAPAPFSISATAVPQQIRDIIPLQAAIRAWKERGAQEEVTRLGADYAERLSAWRQMMQDMGLDEQDAQEWQTFESQDPHAGTLRPVMLTPNPLWP